MAFHVTYNFVQGYDAGQKKIVASEVDQNFSDIEGYINNSSVNIADPQTISGTKTFTSNPSVKNVGPAITLQQTDVTKGTNPSVNQGTSITIVDSAGTAIANRTGLLENRVDAAGTTSTSIYAYQFANGSTAYAGLGLYCSADGNTKQLRPSADNKLSLGVSNSRWSQLFAGTATINTSDEREKDNIEPITDAVLDAWGEVNFQQYQFKDAIAEKGTSARLHSGVIAQRVIEVFKEHGLDATRYGLLCYNTWEAEDYDETIVDKEAVTDAEGNIIEPEVSHIEHYHTDAGDRYGIRYEEALCLEAAYQRRRADRLEARIAAIEARLDV